MSVNSSSRSPHRATEATCSDASTNPIRLLYVRDTLTMCGPGKTILSTWRTINRARFHLTIVATQPTAGGRNLLLDTARKIGAQAIALSIGRGIDLVAAWRLVRLLRQHRIDILQTHDAQTRRIGVLAAALTGTYHITSVHGWIFNDWKERAAKWLDARLIRRADAVIAVSDRLRKELQCAGVPPKRITVLRNAIVLEDYIARNGGPGLCQQLGLQKSHRIVSIIGRLSPEKGHEVFLQAARLIVNELPEVRFLVVGDGPLGKALRTRVEELGLTSHVIFTGHRTDLSEIYGVTDVLVISSFTEGIPNVLLEAFAYGKPAVATAVGGVPEVLRDGGNGWLVAAGDPGTIATRVLTLLKDESIRERMGAAGRAAIEHDFNFAHRTRALEQLYARALLGPDADCRLSSVAPQEQPKYHRMTSVVSNPVEGPLSPKAPSPTTTWIVQSVAALRRVANYALRMTQDGADRTLHSRRRHHAVAQIVRVQPRSVLMVCFGNICRSPYAALALAKALGASDMVIGSAGFIGPNRPSPAEAQIAAIEFGVDLTPHRSRVLTPEILSTYDLVVVMEPSQRRTLLLDHQVPVERILVLGDFDPLPIRCRRIVDPYSGSPEVFTACYRRIHGCVDSLAAVIRRSSMSAFKYSIGSKGWQAP